jgi:hypothetical protein
MKTFPTLPYELTISFPSEDHMNEFASWLSEQGEQDFSYWCGIRELPDLGHVQYRMEDETIPHNKAERYGPWLEDKKIAFNPKNK